MPSTLSSEALGLPDAGSALGALHVACRSLDMPFFLVGALARDILLHHLRRVDRVFRLTRDVDVAVGVASWTRFEALRRSLVEDHDFSTTRTLHRIVARSGLIVDILPFGGIENEEHQVRWPPNYDTALSVVGFREALRLTETVRIDDVKVNVIPLHAFGSLKLIAWSDRRHQTTRDAEDFCFVLTSFWEAETERILEAHADLFDAEEGDQDFIGARAYGREAASFVARSEQLTDELLGLLARETLDIDTSKLAVAMGTSCTYGYERRFDLLCRFHDGLKERLNYR